MAAILSAGMAVFLSTPSARRATGDKARYKLALSDFYPRPPRGGRPGRNNRPAAPSDISIHALREEGDRLTAQASDTIEHFYPRPPRGGRRKKPANSWGGVLISIHALREEGDKSILHQSPQSNKFLSTPSARRATTVSCVLPFSMVFLSTPSARRATRYQLVS